MDIDFNTIIYDGAGFELEVGQIAVSGNRALLNQFEIVFLTSWRKFYYPELNQSLVESFGGNVAPAIGSIYNLSDTSGISAALASAVSNTVDSIKSEQLNLSIPANERLRSASLEGIYISNSVVYSRVNVIPDVYDVYETIIMNLPVIKRG